VLLTAHLPALLALALLYAALFLLFSARRFRSAGWVHPAAWLAPLALLIALGEAGVAPGRMGWWLTGLAGVYLLQAYLLQRIGKKPYETAALAAGLGLLALGLPFSSLDTLGALWGYAGAVALYAVCAFWLHQPLLLAAACALAVAPYAAGLQRSALTPNYYGLALFPGALAALGLGWLLDRRFGRRQGFPWDAPADWPPALAQRLLEWWALPAYSLGFALASAAPFFTQRTDLRALSFALLALVYAWGVYRFRLRAWLLAAGSAAHLAMVFYLHGRVGWLSPEVWPRFLPMTIATALVGLALEKRLGEGSPLSEKRILAGWSRPLYALLLWDFIVIQAGSLDSGAGAALVSLVHAVLIGLLASAWASPGLPFGSALLGALALGQWLAAGEQAALVYPLAYARLALGYGLVGYGLTLGLRWLQRPGWPAWLGVWARPLQLSSLAISLGALGLAAFLGVDLFTWTARALLGYPFRSIADLPAARMLVGVLSLVGLLYVAAAAAYRRLRLGYLAVGMLLAAWFAYAFYLQAWEGPQQVQWYALPAGLYLLAIGYLEWLRGNRSLARWLDYAAMLLLLGSLFWQTLAFGWRFALALGAEGFGAFWWGSARRLRRFFYAGVTAVILATLGQLLNALQAINQWITFGAIGLLLVLIAILVERRLERIKAWQEILETWE
jgi:hypothetical protein